MPPGPDWQDDPADAACIDRNVARVVAELAQHWIGPCAMPTAQDVRRWHAELYAECRTPSTAYLGNFRGDPSHRDLHDYEVAVGFVQADRVPDRVGVWAADVEAEVQRYFAWLQHSLGILDAWPLHSGTEAFLGEFVRVAATIHGEWVRIHPFANGNGRTARLLVATLCLRYRLPVFLAVKPRPANPEYGRAARASMGRPPAFRGDHSATIALFTRYLAVAVSTL